MIYSSELLHRPWNNRTCHIVPRPIWYYSGFTEWNNVMNINPEWPFCFYGPSHSYMKYFVKALLLYTKEHWYSWWRHQMETFSALLALCAGNSPVPGEFPVQRPVTRGFNVFFDLRLNERLSKQSWGWWFETLSRPLWRHRNVLPTTQCLHSDGCQCVIATTRTHPPPPPPPPPLDKMAAISQTIFSDAFSWMKIFVFWSQFDWSLFLRVQLAITQHWFR